MKRNIIALIMVAFCAFAGNALADAAADQAAARKTALAWLAIVDAHKYAESYSGACTWFQSKVTQKQLEASLTQVRAPLGGVKSRKFVGSQSSKTVAGAPDGDYVVMQFSTDFDKKAGVTETLVYAREKGAWKMAGYRLR